MNVYIKFTKFNKIFMKSTLNFINFYEKYIKFYVYVHKYTF